MKECISGGGGREEAAYLPLCLLQLEQVSEGENLELSSVVKPIILGPPHPTPTHNRKLSWQRRKPLINVCSHTRKLPGNQQQSGDEDEV